MSRNAVSLQESTEEYRVLNFTSSSSTCQELSVQCVWQADVLVGILTEIIIIFYCYAVTTTQLTTFVHYIRVIVTSPWRWPQQRQKHVGGNGVKKYIVHIAVHFVAYLYIMDLINVGKVKQIKTFHCSGPHSCFTSDLKDGKRSKSSEPVLTGRYWRVLKLKVQHFLSHLAIAYGDMTGSSCS
jgi:hypothetical protein